jgi:hypothetical protein
VDAISPGAGAVITNLARFTDWERWNYDWHLDVEPTLREIAEQQGLAEREHIAKLVDEGRINLCSVAWLLKAAGRDAAIASWHRAL